MRWHVFEFSKQQDRLQIRHPLGPKQPNYANSRRTVAWDPYLSRQSAWGNQDLQRLLRTRVIQAKLKINEPGDKY